MDRYRVLAVETERFPGASVCREKGVSVGSRWEPPILTISTIDRIIGAPTVQGQIVDGHSKDLRISELRLVVEQSFYLGLALPLVIPSLSRDLGRTRIFANKDLVCSNSLNLGIDTLDRSSGDARVFLRSSLGAVIREVKQVSSFGKETVDLRFVLQR